MEVFAGREIPFPGTCHGRSPILNYMYHQHHTHTWLDIYMYTPTHTHTFYVIAYCILDLHVYSIHARVLSAIVTENWQWSVLYSYINAICYHAIGMYIYKQENDN